MPLLEFFPESQRPVLRANLPTVNVRHREGLPPDGRLVLQQFSHQSIELHLDRLLAQLVALQTKALFGSRMVHLSGGGMPNA